MISQLLTKQAEDTERAKDPIYLYWVSLVVPANSPGEARNQVSQNAKRIIRVRHIPDTKSYLVSLEIEASSLTMLGYWLHYVAPILKTKRLSLVHPGERN